MLARVAAGDDDAVARAAAHAFGVPAGAEITEIRRRENVVFRVRAPGLDRALRLHRPGYRTDAELDAETATLEALRARDLPVPAPVRTADGRAVVSIEHAGERRQASMQDWIGGGVLGTSRDVFRGRARPDDAQFRALGTAAARLHEAAMTGAPAGYERASWDAVGLAGDRALWGDPARLTSSTPAERSVLRAATTQISAALAGADASPDRFGLIHADLTFENVLVTPGGLALLDFDDSGSGWYLFDLATPFFWCTRHPDAAEILAALVAGYRSIRPLDPDTADWHALLLARGLSYLGWAADRPGDAASAFIEDHVAPWVLDACRRYLETGGTGWPAPPPIPEVSA